MTGSMFKAMALAACLAFVLPGIVQARHGRSPKHVHAGRTGAGTVVTAGSDVRITNVGEVIVPPIAIVVVNTAPPNRQAPGKTQTPPP